MNAIKKLKPGMRVRILGQRIGDTLMGLTLQTDTGTLVGPDASDMDYYVVRPDAPAEGEHGEHIAEVVWLEDNLRPI